MSFIKRILDKIKAKTEDEETNMYYSYYLFGQSNGKPIWDWANWKKCIRLLQPFIDLSSDIPFIKSSQSVPVTYGENNQFTSYNKGSLSFGKMTWNEKNNEKWTTKYLNEIGWRFIDTEIAYPTRSHCHKNKTNPELFITIHNENLADKEEPKIDQAITIHIKTDLINSEKMVDLEKYIYQIGSLLNWKIAGKMKRPTSYKSARGLGYTDSFWDGSYGVLTSEDDEFSDNYRRYGIMKIKIDSN